MPNNEIEFQLNSFVRRTQDTDSLKQLILKRGGSLSRKGRSRNWQLKISLQDIRALVSSIYEANQPSWLWLAKLLSEYKESYTFDDLLLLAKQHASITVSELMTLTDCSISEARRVIDELEWS